MTIATRNGCDLCVAMHTARLPRWARRRGASSRALRSTPRPLPDQRLEAVRMFTPRVWTPLVTLGDEALQAFLDSGFTTPNALEIVLGIGAYTMSTLANRLTGAPVDEQLRAYRLTPWLGAHRPGLITPSDGPIHGGAARQHRARTGARALTGARGQRTGAGGRKVSRRRRCRGRGPRRCRR